MEGLTAGRIVHYVMPDGNHRPAIVVQVWDHDANGPGLMNCQVLTDGTNDVPWGAAEVKAWKDMNIDPEDCHRGLLWRTSISYSEEPKPHTWHWIEKA